MHNFWRLTKSALSTTFSMTSHPLSFSRRLPLSFTRSLISCFLHRSGYFALTPKTALWRILLESCFILSIHLLCLLNSLLKTFVQMQTLSLIWPYIGTYVIVFKLAFLKMCSNDWLYLKRHYKSKRVWLSQNDSKSITLYPPIDYFRVT